MRQLPNAVTSLRALSAIAILVLLISNAAALALAVFAVAASTDALDGWLARRLRARSDLGTFLDPLADKILIAGALGGLVALGAVDGIVAASIMAREGVVTAVRAVAFSRGTVIGSNAAGKVKAGLQGSAVAAQLVALTWPDLGAGQVADAAILVAAVATVATGVDVVRRGAAALALRASPMRAHAR